ncbi:hypothetical protein BGZ46_005590 [Entomortierella lignicola]|nr:hypothetical protein BGZ46_005590 [Entomortierella lignicola]
MLKTITSLAIIASMTVFQVSALNARDDTISAQSNIAATNANANVRARPTPIPSGTSNVQGPSSPFDQPSSAAAPADVGEEAKWGLDGWGNGYYGGWGNGYYGRGWRHGYYGGWGGYPWYGRSRRFYW